MLLAIIKITILFTGILLLVHMLRSRAALRHRVLACAIAASLALPVLTALLPAWQSPAISRALAPRMLVPNAFSAPAQSTITAMIVTAQDSIPTYNPALALWAIGTLLLLARLVAGTIMQSRCSTRLLDETWLPLIADLSQCFGVRRRVRLLVSDKPHAMPVTYGHFRPVILLPPEAIAWSETRKRLVLSHELAHIGRNDWVYQILAELACSLYWFHPLVWSARSRLKQESERAADDAVLLSGVKPSDYASELLELSRTLTHSGRLCQTVLAMATTSHLERRFINMLNTTTNHCGLSHAAAVTTAFAALSVMLPMAALQLPGQERAGQLTGSVSDPRSAALRNATIIVSDQTTHTTNMTTADSKGAFTFRNLPAGTYEMQVLQPGFQTYLVPEMKLEIGREARQDVTMILSDSSEPVPVRTAVTGAKSIRIGGNVAAENLLTKVRPLYPPSAKASRIQGSVRLGAEIDSQGNVTSLYVTNTDVDPALAQASVEAVQQWKYKPVLLNGEPVNTTTSIAVNFTLVK